MSINLNLSQLPCASHTHTTHTRIDQILLFFWPVLFFFYPNFDAAGKRLSTWQPPEKLSLSFLFAPAPRVCVSYTSLTDVFPP